MKNRTDEEIKQARESLKRIHKAATKISDATLEISTKELAFPDGTVSVKEMSAAIVMASARMLLFFDRMQGIPLKMTMGLLNEELQRLGGMADGDMDTDGQLPS